MPATPPRGAINPAQGQVEKVHCPEARESIILAVAGRSAPDLPRLSSRVRGTIAEVLAVLVAGRVNRAMLDGEAEPTGGFGLAHQLQDEIEEPIDDRRRPLTGRPLARQLATSPGRPSAAAGPSSVAETVADVSRPTRPRIGRGARSGNWRHVLVCLAGEGVGFALLGASRM
jgi:hypothetical protein